jgi:hypothetical protein
MFAIHDGVQYYNKAEIKLQQEALLYMKVLCSGMDGCFRLDITTAGPVGDKVTTGRASMCYTWLHCSK